MPMRSLCCRSRPSGHCALPPAIAEPARFQRLELGGIVGRLADCLDEPVAIVPTRRRHHELDVLHVLAVVTPELVDRHVDEMRAGYFAEFVEEREEFVVAGRHGGRWQEGAIENASTSWL